MHTVTIVIRIVKTIEIFRKIYWMQLLLYPNACPQKQNALYCIQKKKGSFSLLQKLGCIFLLVSPNEYI